MDDQNADGRPKLQPENIDQTLQVKSSGPDMESCEAIRSSREEKSDLEKDVASVAHVYGSVALGLEKSDRTTEGSVEASTQPCPELAEKTEQVKVDSLCNLEKESLRNLQVGTEVLTRVLLNKKNSDCDETNTDDVLSNSSILRDDSIVEFSVENIFNNSDGEARESVVQQTKTVYDSSEVEMCQQTVPISLQSEEMCAASCSQSSSQDPKNYNCLIISEIENILTSASSACSPDDEFEISQVDFSSAPKENVMRMLSRLLDECNTLKKEKAK